MLFVRDLISGEGYVPSPAKEHSRPLLSIIILCRLPEHGTLAKELIELCGPSHGDLEIIVIGEPSSGESSEQSTGGFASWCMDQGCKLIMPGFACGLPALRFNEGILASQGDWVWLMDLDHPMPSLGCEAVLGVVSRASKGSVFFLVHPDDETNLLDIPGVRLPWLDVLFKGTRFPLENILFPRSLFAARGLFDPHIAVQSFFLDEFLRRVCRHVQFEKIDDAGAVAGIRQERLPTVFTLWLDAERWARLLYPRILDYSVDDLRQFESLIPRSILWDAYLQYVLPYYFRFRHQIPEGFPERVQSLAPRRNHIQCIKSFFYETLIDVGFRNFDVFSQGERFFKTNYTHIGQLNEEDVYSHDGILFIRSAEDASLSLARHHGAAGLPVGYALDDDLLNFQMYGGEYSGFKAGNPMYDSMVNTIEAADVVLCSSPYIEESVARHNPRTVHFEGSMLPEFLPTSPRRERGVFKFGYAGGGYRKSEMQMLWPAIERICKEYGEEVSIELWGIDPSDFPNHPPQVSFVPFSISYYEYLGRLKDSGFDATLVPLLLDPLPRRAKAPNKLYETAVAGAVGLYSNVPSYRVVGANHLGLLVEENSQAWYDAMHRVLEMPRQDYENLQARSLAFVKEFYSTPAMLQVHETGLEAILFHGKTRGARDTQGRPRVMYVFPTIGGTGGGEILFRRRIDIAVKAGIAPLAIVPEQWRDSDIWETLRDYLDARNLPYDFALYTVHLATPPAAGFLPIAEEEESIRELMRRQKVALVHTGGFMPAFGKVCSDLNIPHVVSCYGVDDAYEWPCGQLPFKHCDVVQSDSIRYAVKWSQLFDSHWSCARDVVPEVLFERGFKALYGQAALGNPGRTLKLGIVGTIMPRKCQLETIQAVSLLRGQGYSTSLSIVGGSSDDDYYARCRQVVEEQGLRDVVSFRGHLSNITELYADMDILLTVSTFESFPNSIKEATAAGVLVIASLAGGIGELVVDMANGIISEGSEPGQIAHAVKRAAGLSPEDTMRIRRNAYSMARQEFHPRRGLADLMAIYNLALQTCGSPELNGGSPVPRTSSTYKPAFPRGGQQSRAVGDKLIPPEKQPSGHSRLVRKLSYSIIPGGQNWKGVDVLVGTHERPARGFLTLEVLSASGGLLRKVSSGLAEVQDNSWVGFQFEPVLNSSGHRFVLNFCLTEAGGHTRISIYETASAGRRIGRLFRRFINLLGIGSPRSTLYCQTRYL